MRKLLFCVAVLLIFMVESVEALTYTEWNAPYESLALEMSIAYESIDLPDVIQGEDLWQYDYSFLDTTHWDQFSLPDLPNIPIAASDEFHVGDQLSIAFHESHIYESLLYEDIIPSANDNWNVDIMTSMSVNFPESIVVHYIPNQDSPALTGFSTQFIWNGAGSPGSQQVAFYDVDSFASTYDVYFDTVPQPVPEPTTILLLGSGLVGLAGLRRKYKK